VLKCVDLAQSQYPHYILYLNISRGLRRPPGTEHSPRAILAAHEVKHLDHLVSRSSYRVKLLLQLPERVPAPSFSTGLALSSVDSQRRQGTQGTR